MNELIISCIGFLAQAFFAARVIVQWVMSEKAQKVLSPTLFWVFSIVGAYLFFIYGWLRDDFSIVFGQVIAYYVYVWNLKIKGVWKAVDKPLQYVVLNTPVATIAAATCNIVMGGDMNEVISKFFDSEKIPLWLVIFGSFGQIVFTLRFVFQWYYSKHKGESLFPLSFWIISIIGSLTIIIYSIFRHDLVLFISQVSVVVYIRNLMIHIKNLKEDKCPKDNGL